MKFSKLFVLMIIVLVATQGRVHAYTDPGSGTLIWQMLMAAGIGLMFYVRKISLWVRDLKNRKSSVSNAVTLAGSRESSRQI
jgi:hypothetical protein